MAKKKYSLSNTSISVDKKYFDNCFEPERKRLGKKLGMNLTQRQFTAYLHNSKAKIQYPTGKNTYAPRKKWGKYVPF